MRLYTRKQLQQKMEESGVKRSRITVLKYEKNGTIPKPSAHVEGVNGVWRLYTEEEVDSIIRIFKEL